jgi:hypothetical protein
MEERAQRLLAGARFDQVLAEGLEDRLERQQVLLDVVDEQEVDGLGRAQAGTSRERAGGTTSP